MLRKTIALTFLLVLIPLVSFALIPDGQVITTLTLKEVEGITTQNYPLTFGHVFKEGDVNSTVTVRVNGTDIPTQCDIKRHWDDGSIKHAIISVVLPEVVANQDTVIELIAGGTNDNSDWLDKDEILATDIESRVELKNISGSGYSGNATASLRTTIQNQSSLDYWLKGSICTEILATQQINNSLDATWEARFYPGTNFGIRVSNSIENVSAIYRGNVGYDVIIYMGYNSPELKYSKTQYSHTHNSRWRKIYWIGNAPPETELHYDINYLISTGMIINYDTNVVVAESEISDEYNNWLNSDTDIDGNGFITKYFPTTGGRREIGILPKWTAMYLLSMDNRTKEIMLGNADMVGHCPSHYREDDSNMTFFGHTVSIDDRINIDIGSGESLPAPIGDMDNNGWVVDRAHQGSFVYVPYLITGEYWYLQELYFWAGFNLAFDNYGRDGYGNPQDFSQGKDTSYGALYDQTRGFAWAIRTITNAAVIATDDDLEKNYFSAKVENNVDWHLMGNTETSHGIHFYRNMREHMDDPNPWKTREAPWQHDFVVCVFSDMLRKKVCDTNKIQELRDRWGKFTVGRFTQPDFNKWDGAGYWWPLKRKSDDNSGDYFDNGSWSEFWDEVLLMDQEVGTGTLPHSDLSHYDYPDSYAFIARAAITNLTHLSKGYEAYSFLNDNLTISALSTNPTWALSPEVQINSPTIKITYPTSNDSWTTDSNEMDLGGNASEGNNTLTKIVWTNDRGGSGEITSNLNNWMIQDIQLAQGLNNLTVTVYDSDNLTATDSLAVTSTYTPPAGGNGTEWFVNGDCEHNGDGTGIGCASVDGQPGAWKDLNYIVWGTNGVKAGDILFISGHTNDRTFITESGTADNPIIITKYPEKDQLATLIWDYSGYEWIDLGDGRWSSTTYTAFFKEDGIVQVKASDENLTDGVWFYGDGKTYYRPSSGTPADHTLERYPYRYPFNLQGSDYITFRNLKFKDVVIAISNPGGSGTSDHITVTNCTFTDTPSSAIYLRDDNNIDTTGNEITYNTFIRTAQAILFNSYQTSYEGVRDSVVAYNKFYDNGYCNNPGKTWREAGSGSDGEIIGLQNPVNVRVTNNWALHSWKGIVFWSADDGETHDCIIANNYLKDVYEYGICIQTEEGGDVYNNKVYYNVLVNTLGGNRGIHLNNVQGTPNNAFYNNFISGYKYNINLGHNINNVNFLNNLSYDPTSKHIAYRFADSNMGGNGGAFNNYYPDGPDKFQPAYGQETDFNGWKSATGHDMTSFIYNPGLVDEYHISRTSPVRDKAAPILGLHEDWSDWAKDIDDDYVTDGRPDVGADEFRIQPKIGKSNLILE